MQKAKMMARAATVMCAGAMVAVGVAGPATAATTTGSAAKADTPTTAATDPVLSGDRWVTIVRVQSFESGVALPEDGFLREADDDSGRQLFVPKPLGGDEYLIKAYDDANDRPLCWQEYHPQTTASLRVEGASCNPRKPEQRFTITAVGDEEYAISNRSAYLQRASNGNLILEELGDAALDDTYRLVDNGPAPHSCH
ncbi:hypothetical protein [Mangrovihabitans endophyticus]|uniref:Uncharacterized protein n=1 Tax=Mangrovihabitans endophyticus TaxID=1751298 RepID=A0A8J3FNV5_9ACTN|nr:hypothetical protein [Mangrovihabitans endophyticus]GGK94559.1 hypothetical protein GCM10012284_30690 [Mangrovihabitans endophyticus]